MTVSVSYDADYARQYDTRPVKAMSEVRWNFIQAHLNLPVNSRVLDIGYGNGAFLKHARTAGMKIYGIDIHSENFGIPNVDFDTSLAFDLICFFDSLEHFSDFSPILKLNSRHAIISMPNTPSFVLSRPQAWRHFKPGEHLHYFSRKSLDTFMGYWGFPHKVADGYPEDELRGKLFFGQEIADNIYTALYARASTSSF